MEKSWRLVYEEKRIWEYFACIVHGVGVCAGWAGDKAGDGACLVSLVPGGLQDGLFPGFQAQEGACGV